MKNLTERTRKIRATWKKSKLWMVICAAVLVVVVVAVIVFRVAGKEESGAAVSTTATLEKIIEVSDLSTFTAVYNGVAQVNNEKNPEKTDYYVSYEAKVNAGIDLEKVRVSQDSGGKQIKIDIPEVSVTEVNVDISSLEFIFYNTKVNTSAVTQEAFKSCEEDVLRESKEQTAILALAQQNAENVLTALTRPIVEQLEPGYTVEIV